VASDPRAVETDQKFTRQSAWILATLTRPPAWRPSLSVALIATFALVIGAVDYWLGPDISLRPAYYLPIALAVAWLGWRPGVLVAVGCVGVWLASEYCAGSARPVGVAGFWNSLIGFLSFLLVVWALQVLLALHREMEQRIAARTASLEAALATQAALRRELIEVGARERTAVGRELHDGLCQHLTATAMAAQVLADRLAAQRVPAAGDARAIVGLMQEGITQSRQLASGLLLEAIAPERLAGQLQALADHASRQSGVACRLEVTGEPQPPDAASAAQLFRIAQEAVRNAVRHAQATRITIALAGDGRELTLAVTDNGAGLPPAQQRDSGMGLEIMAHRARSIGGALQITTLAGGGTRVTCRLPSAAGADGI
jgi:signal transduction histidine kinase